MTTVGRWSPNKVRKRLLDGDWASRFTASAPPSVPITPTPTGKYYTFTSSTSFTLEGLSPLPVSLVVVGGGNPGYNGYTAPFNTPKGSGTSYNGGGGGTAGVANYQPSATLAPGTYTITIGGVTSTSGIYNAGPGTAVYTAAGGPGNPFLAPSTYGGGGSGGPSNSTQSGGPGTTTPWGTFAGGGGGWPGGTGGPGGGGYGGTTGYGGNATNYGSGGGGGGADANIGAVYPGGTGAAGLVIIQVPSVVQ